MIAKWSLLSKPAITIKDSVLIRGVNCNYLICRFIFVCPRRQPRYSDSGPGLQTFSILCFNEALPPGW
jgi:hypothetical protein